MRFPRLASKSWKRALLVLAVLALLALALEGAWRWALFGDNDLAARWGRPIRKAWMYTDRWNEEDYWYLAQLFTGEPGPLREHVADPLLGWRSDVLVLETYDHLARAEVGGRRPVLLYGDSFAMCMTEPDECWEGLLERSELGSQLKLVNYGMRGYGIDQAYLLLRQSLPLWKDLDPIVVFGIFLEDDLDRAWLSFRGWPKPHFALVDDELELDSPRVVPHEQWMAEHDPAITSYLARWLMFHPAFPERVRVALLGQGELQHDKQVLSAAILDQTIAFLRQHEVDFFFVLFHGEADAMELLPRDWREWTCMDSFGRNQAEWVTARRELQRDWLESGRNMSEYFGKQERFADHYNALGQRVVFRAFEAGLRGEFESRYQRCTCEPESYAAAPDLHGITYARDSKALRKLHGFEETIVMRLEGTPRRLRWQVDGRCGRFSVRVVLPRAAEAEGEPAVVRLVVRAGPKPLFQGQVKAGDPALEIDVRLGQTNAVELVVEPLDTAAHPSVILLGDPRFE